MRLRYALFGAFLAAFAALLAYGPVLAVRLDGWRTCPPPVT